MITEAQLEAIRRGNAPTSTRTVDSARDPRFGRAGSPRFGDVVRRLARDDRGATVIEYGLLAALVALAMISSLGDAGKKLEKVFDEIAETLGFDDGKGPKKPKKPKKN